MSDCCQEAWTFSDRFGPRRRVFLHKQTNTVYKYFDNLREEDKYLNPNIIRKLISNVMPLPNITLTPSGKRVHTLSYTFVKGNNCPAKLRSFVGVVKTLSRMHEHKLVHGDVRQDNLVFPEDSGDSYLIDFDFVGEHSTSLYPADYNDNFNERHQDAHTGCLMMLSHDRFSLAYVIRSNVPGAPPHIVEQLLDLSFSLNHIVSQLESTDD